MKTKLSKRLLDKPYLIWSVLFIIVPLIMVIYYSFTDSAGNFTLKYIEAIPNYASVFLLSVLYGIGATAICLLLGYPFALLLTKVKASSQRVMVLLVMLPMWTNFLIRTYSWMTILGDSGIINTALNYLGFDGIKLINTPFAVMLGMVYNFLPFMILPIYSVISKMDSSYFEAARDLGAGRAQVFKKITLPLSAPGILSGIIMVFVPCVSTFYITQKLGGGQIVLIGDVIETQFQSANNYNLGASLSLVLMILILICLGVMNSLGADGNDDGGIIL
ncbi:MAG: ABC transporter permease [Clostridiales bacterium]|nr:ABC transporter permease [Clostridiales bacterium]